MKTGILNRATSAKAANEQKTAEEELKLGVSALSIDYRKNTTNSQTFRQFVTSNSGANLKTAMGLETTNTDLIIENAENGILSYKGQKYQVDDYGGVRNYVPVLGWEQNKTEVTKDGVTLEVGQAVTGYSVTANVGGIEKTIGDGNWYVLGAKDGKLLITTITNQENIQLSGKDGFTSGVATLNSAAEKYTNSQYADGNARSINVDDINRVTGYDPDVAQYNAGTENVNQWDNDVIYTLNNNRIYYKGTKYPRYPEDVNDELGKESSSSYSSFEYCNGSSWIKLGEGANPIQSEKIKNTSYYYYPNTLTASNSGSTIGIETDSTAYTLLFTNTGYWKSGGGPPTFVEEEPYWLASKFEYCSAGSVEYGLRKISVGIVDYGNVYASNGEIYSKNLGLRPVITLSSDVKVSRDGVITK